MNRLNVISVSFYLLTIAMVTACSDVNPVESVASDIDETSDDIYEERHRYSSSDNSYIPASCVAGYGYDSWCCSNYGTRCDDYVSESDKCYYGTSSYSDSWCCTNYGYRCNYVSSSSRKYSSSSSYRYSSSSARSSSSSVRSSSSSVKSSSSIKEEVVEAHTSKTKTMEFTLKYYKQGTSCWDDALCLSATYSDGDPTISFNIYFIASGGQSNAKSTGNLISLQDQGIWSGVATKEIEVPIGTQDIKVCPSVIDKDVLDNDNKSSGYCYTITNVGYLEDYAVMEQSDSETAIYVLKWEWYLY